MRGLLSASVLAGLCVALLVGCFGGDGKSALVGRWYLADGPSKNNPEKMELLKDGSGIIDGMGMTWKTEKGRFYLTYQTGQALAYNYKMSGSILTLTTDKDEILGYTNSEDGKLYGKWEVYYSNGKLRETGNYDKDGKKDGEWKYYSVSGQLEKVNDYKTISQIECVLVKAGNFKTLDGTTVTLTEDFYIGKYPVTQAQYQAVMGNNPSRFSGDDKPVETVTWQDAVYFCKKVGGFLPTEAQWEFAARGGNNSKSYIYSGSNNLYEVGWYDDNSRQTQFVGQKNPNELGIYDMSGNVWEWTADWNQSSYPSSGTNPTGASSGSLRVVRGGSWLFYVDFCRVSNRNGYGPDNSRGDQGFRVAFPPQLKQFLLGEMKNREFNETIKCFYFLGFS
jgi:hypothetical protein